MATTSSYSKVYWQLFRKTSNSHPVGLSFIALLITIPLAHSVNNIALMFFALTSLLTWSKTFSFRTKKALLLPVAFFVLMALSLIWSIDVPQSAGALPKELALLAVPVCFMMFPAFSRGQKKNILDYYAYAMVFLGAFYLARAAVRWTIVHDTGVFFYHELVTKEVNAIHVSCYMAVAFFVFLSKEAKTVYDWCCVIFLTLILVLLSSKNIIVVFLLLLALYYLFYSGISVQKRLLSLATLLLLAALPLLFSPKIADRFRTEFETALADRTKNTTSQGETYNVSLRQAWQQERFSPQDYFPGGAFRVYQFRIFIEMLCEDPIFWTGYGLNASYGKIRQKAVEHNLYMGDGKESGYQGKNFHNQYVQNFADLGVFGLLLLLAMVVLNLKKGICAKDFTHISFAVLMISLFLTESFLWRQRGVVFFTAMYCLFNAGPVAFAAAQKK